MIESSGTLIVNNVRPEDEGFYSCRAENLLGSVNTSAKLTVQCELCLLFNETSEFKDFYASRSFTIGKRGKSCTQEPRDIV